MKKYLILGLLVTIGMASGCGLFRSAEGFGCSRSGMCNLGPNSAPQFSMLGAPMEDCCEEAPGAVYQP